MFNAVRNNKRLVQLFLALITVPFALWGVESYVQSASRDEGVAEVGRSKITQAEFQDAMRDAQGRMREQMGAKFDPAMLQRSDIRESILEDLVSQRLIDLQLDSDRMRAGPDVLREAIGNNPAFAENGGFSMARYERLLAERGYSRARYEALLSKELGQRQLMDGVAASVVVPMTSIDRWLALQDETRDVEVALLPALKFEPQIKLAAGAARKSYDADRSQWQQPEQLRIEYVVLNPSAIAADIAVTDEMAHKQYESAPDRYTAPEERQVSHILIEVAKDAAPEKRKQARDKAESLLKDVKAKPERFADIAKASSQDLDSAPKGGDLGFLPRGGLKELKPVEDAAYKMKPGEISGVVESDFGFHIVKLGDVHPGGVRGFDSVKTAIVEDVRRDLASKKFAEMAEGFGNTVYEQPDSLKPVAEKYKLSVQQSPLVDRGARDLPFPLDNEKVLKAVFSADAIKTQRNTEAIDLGDGRLVSARVVEHKAAAVKPFETVQAQIEKKLVAQEALKLSVAEGSKQLEVLRKGGTASELDWSKSQSVSRGKATIPLDLLKAVFRDAAGKLPTYVGVELPGSGFGIAKITAVTKGVAPKADDPRRKAFAEQYARLLAEVDRSAYFSALRSRYGVKVNKALLEVKE